MLSSKTITTKFEEEIILLKELCTHMDIINSWETQMKITVFVMRHYIMGVIKEDEPPLIRTLMAL